MSKLRIASYYENRLGRNDGNPLYMWNAFKQRNDIESVHFIPHGDLTRYGKYDLHFEADWGEDALKGVLPYTPCDIPRPNVYWASDTHLGYDYRLSKAKRFDYVFCAQKRAVEDFEKAGVKSVWMPHAVEPKAYPYLPSIKRYDICFVGHINSENRVDALDFLFKQFPNFFYGQRLFEEAAEMYCESKIVFNISHKDDINMRVFETLATKSFLLTNWIPTLPELFEDGKHMVMYKTQEEMVEKAKYYISHDAEREAIAEAGQKEVLKNHTFLNRVQTVLDVVGLNGHTK